MPPSLLASADEVIGPSELQCSGPTEAATSPTRQRFIRSDWKQAIERPRPGSLRALLANSGCLVKGIPFPPNVTSRDERYWFLHAMGHRGAGPTRIPLPITTMEPS